MQNLVFPLAALCLVALACSAALLFRVKRSGRLLRDASRGLRDARAALDTMSDALIVLDRDGNFVELNRHALAMFGIADSGSAASMGMSDLSALKSEMAPIFKEYWARALAGENVSFEWDAQAADGKTIHAEAQLARIEWAGAPNLIATVHDLTRQKKLENERDAIQAQLFQVQKMDALSQLAGGFAHDFNNTLTGIMGSLSVLKAMNENPATPDRKQIAEYLNAAMESGLRAGDLTRQLLTISRKEETKREPVDMRESLSHILQICRNSFPKSIEVRFHVPESPMPVLGDQTQLEQAMLNVCINAYHAMTIMRGPGEKEGGSLDVVLDETSPDIRMPGLFPVLDQDSRYARITIADTGIGMDADSQKRAFEPFYTTKGEHDGAGLGLYIVYSIMKQHSGSIDIRSDPGCGTTVTLYLPLQPRDGSQAAPRSSSRIIKGEGTVLIIDDESAVRVSAEGMLKICGYRTIVAKSGQEGIDLFTQRRAEISLVLLDVSMPGKSGLEVIGEIRAIAPEAAVIMMSGFVENEKINQAISSGASAFLRKPFSMNSLAGTVKSLLP